MSAVEMSELNKGPVTVFPGNINLGIRESLFQDRETNSRNGLLFLTFFVNLIVFQQIRWQVVAITFVPFGVVLT